MEERRIPVSAGLLRCQIGGQGPSLVLIHGIAASSFSFRLICAELIHSFRLFIPDLLSLSCSTATSQTHGSLHATALVLREFLDRAGIGKTSVLGSSHGGAVAMQLAALAPERFDTLLLVAPANPFAERYRRVVNFYLSPVGGMFIRIAPFMPGRIWNYGIGRMYADPASMMAGTGIGYARALRLRGATRYIRSCLKTFAADVESLRVHLGAIAKIPTLLIWGDRDPVVELESGRKLQKALGAEMVVLRNVGHLPYEEKPGEFNRVVLGWLNTMLKNVITASLSD